MKTKIDLRSLYSGLSCLPADDPAKIVLAVLIDEVAASLKGADNNTKTVWSSHDNLDFEIDLADRLGRALFYGYEQERAELAVFQAICPTGGHVWDVGANFGLYSAHVAKRIGAGGSVHAFEPGAKALEMLMPNIVRNHLTEIVCVHQMALADHDGEGLFFEAEESAFSSLRDTGRSKLVGERRVTVRRADNVWQELGRPKIDAMKIDVEGFESKVLDGALQLLVASPDIILLFELTTKNLNEEGRKHSAAVVSKISGLGFRFWTVDPGNGKLNEISSMIGDLIPENFAANIFAVRRDSPRERDLIAAADKSIKVTMAPMTETERNLCSALSTILLQYWIQKETAIASLRKRTCFEAELVAAQEQLAAVQGQLAATQDQHRAMTMLLQEQTSELQEQQSEMSAAEGRHRHEIELLRQRLTELEQTLRNRLLRWIRLAARRVMRP